MGQIGEIGILLAQISTKFRHRSVVCMARNFLIGDDTLTTENWQNELRDKEESVMGFVPKDAEWYLAEIVQELTVADDLRNVVWRNLTLIHASSPDDAYERAIALGKSGDTKYLNPAGKLVTVRFHGLSYLDVIHDQLEHGAELMFHSEVGVCPNDLLKLLRRKEELRLFLPIRQAEGPDVASGEVIQMVEEQFRIKRPI